MIVESSNFVFLFVLFTVGAASFGSSWLLIAMFLLFKMIDTCLFPVDCFISSSLTRCWASITYDFCFCQLVGCILILKSLIRIIVVLAVEVSLPGWLLLASFLLIRPDICIIPLGVLLHFHLQIIDCCMYVRFYMINRHKNKHHKHKSSRKNCCYDPRCKFTNHRGNIISWFVYRRWKQNTRLASTLQ